MPKVIAPGIFAVDVPPIERYLVGEQVGKIGQMIGQEDFVRRWKIAECQISAAIKPHGLLLMVDPDGNYSVERDN